MTLPRLSEPQFKLAGIRDEAPAAANSIWISRHRSDCSGSSALFGGWGLCVGMWRKLSLRLGLRQGQVPLPEKHGKTPAAAGSDQHEPKGLLNGSSVPPFTDDLQETIGKISQAYPSDDFPHDTVTVYHAYPAVGQFEARLTNRKLPIRSDGISVSKLRADWLRSLGLSDSPAAQEPPQSIADRWGSSIGTRAILDPTDRPSVSLPASLGHGVTVPGLGCQCT